MKKKILVERMNRCSSCNHRYRHSEAHLLRRKTAGKRAGLIGEITLDGLLA
jgi:hypothetical protein